ncbi:MAG: HPr family phosphocarrier protein [Gammaproteobacteria bacterium]|jgi:phosphocarrier protein
MQRKTITIINKLGLHARAAAKFVQVASGFYCEINIHFAGKDVSGKSIMGVMMLAAGKGSDIEIIASGADEDEAINSMEQLIQDRFGENE